MQFSPRCRSFGAKSNSHSPSSLSFLWCRIVNCSHRRRNKVPCQSARRTLTCPRRTKMWLSCWSTIACTVGKQHSSTVRTKDTLHSPLRPPRGLRRSAYCRAWFAADRVCVADVALDALPKRKTDGSLVLETKQHMYKVANPRCEAVDHLCCDTQLDALCPLPSLSSASPNRARR